MPHITIELAGRNIFRGAVSGQDPDRHAIDATQGIRLALSSPIGALLTGDDISALREGPRWLRLGCINMRSLQVRINTVDGVETVIAEDDDEIFDLSSTSVTDIIPVPADTASPKH